MKRFILCLLSIILFSASVSLANSFDLSFLPGLKKGLTMKQVCALLDRDSIKYELKNNGNAGKYINVVDVKIKYQTIVIENMKFGFNNGKLSSFKLTALDHCFNLAKYFDTICNCRIDKEEDGSYYGFDNGSISYGDNEDCEFMFMFNSKIKCK